VLVEPAVEQSSTFAIGKVVAYVEEGYRAAVQALARSPAAERLLPQAAR